MQTGRKTRARIWRKGRDWREQRTELVEDGVTQIRASLNQSVTSLRQQASELEQQIKAMINEGGSRFSPAFEAAGTARHQTRQPVKQEAQEESR